MVPIKSFRSIILGINHQRKHGDLGAHGARRRIRQQRAAQPLPADGKINGQVADPGDGHRGVARHALAQ